MPGQQDDGSSQESLELQRWRQALAEETLPASLRSSGDAGRVARRVPPPPATAEEALVPVPPGSRSYARAAEVLPPNGTILDVGAGAGGASLPLTQASHVSAITAVDTNRAQLAAMAQRGQRLGVPVIVVQGTWPEVADRVLPADVVTCHHVLYAVHDLASFALALTSHARHRVVVEIPEHHPQWPLNPLWARFHGLHRPDRPTATDAVKALRALGLALEAETWVDELGWGDYEDFDELAERTRQRLLLPPDRTAAVAEALLELGVDPRTPKFPGTVGRRLVTIWWQGNALHS